MKCSHCGFDNQNDSLFCSNCGYKIIIPKSKPLSRKLFLPLALYLLFIGLFIFWNLCILNNNLERIATDESSSDKNIETQIDINHSNDVQEYELENYSGSDFDLNVEEEIIDINPISKKIVSITPQSGPPGTIINIDGQEIHAEDFTEIRLNGISMPLFNITNNRIQVIVTKEMESGKLEIVYDNEIIDVGNYFVEMIPVTLVIDQIIDVSEQPVNVKTEDISITVPAGVLKKPAQLTVERIESIDCAANFAKTIRQGNAYSINIEDETEFSEPLMIEFTLPGDYDMTPLVMYNDEKELTWVGIDSEVRDNKLIVETNHLTDFWFDLWYECATSPDGYFSVYYDADDAISVPGVNSIEELATSTASALDTARKSYYKYLS